MELRMNQKIPLGLRGPLVLAAGGTFIVFPLLSYAQQLYDGRLSFPYEGAAMGMTLSVCLFVFLGFLIAGLGLEMILEDSR